MQDSKSNAVDLLVIVWYNKFDKLEFVEVKPLWYIKEQKR